MGKKNKINILYPRCKFNISYYGFILTIFCEISNNKRIEKKNKLADWPTLIVHILARICVYRPDTLACEELHVPGLIFKNLQEAAAL